MNEPEPEEGMPLAATSPLKRRVLGLRFAGMLGRSMKGDDGS
jgi:hypothetical protein